MGPSAPFAGVDRWSSPRPSTALLTNRPVSPSDPEARTVASAPEDLATLMEAVDAAEDAGELDLMTTLARRGLAQAAAVGDADKVLDLCGALCRRLAFDDDYASLVEFAEPWVHWMDRASDAVSCVRLGGMLAIAYATLHRVDRAFGLMRRIRALPLAFSAEASFLLASMQGELNANLFRVREALPFHREARAALQSCEAAQRTPHRQVIAHINLATALLTNAMLDRDDGNAAWRSGLGEVQTLLQELAPLIDQFALLKVSLVVLRGHCHALLGQADAASQSAVIGLPESDLGLLSPMGVNCLFDWVSTEAAACRARQDRPPASPAALEGPDSAVAPGPG